MGFLQRLVDNQTIIHETMAVSLRRSRAAGPRSNLAGIAGLGAAWYVLPGVLMLPFMLVWGMERWQYDTVVTWAHLVSTVILIAWYLRITDAALREFLPKQIQWAEVASGVVTGTALAALSGLLWGVRLGDGVTIIALRFDPAVDIAVIALFVGAVVLTPLVQEAFFRGVLQDHAKNALSPGRAILVSGTAFALLYSLLFYIGNAASMAVTVVFLLPQGCLLGYLYQHHGTIVAPAIAQTIVNLYAFRYLLV
jgi:membrane protease YdiL (CAAX protease family)